MVNYDSMYKKAPLVIALGAALWAGTYLVDNKYIKGTRDLAKLATLGGTAALVVSAMNKSIKNRVE